MATLKVSLPDPMHDWVEAQAMSGRYATVGDYVRDLIGRERARAEALVDLQDMIDEGLRSGISDRTMSNVLDEARREAQAAP